MVDCTDTVLVEIWLGCAVRPELTTGIVDVGYLLSNALNGSVRVDIVIGGIVTGSIVMYVVGVFGFIDGGLIL